MLRDCKAKLLFVGPDFLQHLEAIEGRLATVKKVIALGPPHGRHESYAAWVARQRPDDPGLESAPDDIVRKRP